MLQDEVVSLNRVMLVYEAFAKSSATSTIMSS